MLFSRIKEKFNTGDICGNPQESDIITRERHKVLIEQAITYVDTAVSELHESVPEDLVSLNLHAAYMALGEILGMEIGDDIVDRIFAEFCVGK